MAVSDWVLPAAHPTRVERLEARFAGHGFTPHRHDTYAIGRTLAGVQSFNYRRSLRHSLPGGTLVLHPDEVHDGQAGTEAGFQYRMIYVEPALIQQVLGGKPLPFIEGGLCDDPRLFAATQVLLGDMHSAIDPLAEDDALFEVAQALATAGGQRPVRRTLDFVATERARAFIHATLGQPVTLHDLAQASGCDRWSLSRDFRALYGTSPYRYILQRRLDTVRRALRAGSSLVDAALMAGFHDQSHMTRLYTQAFGVSPGRWLRMLGKA
ncbi:AraC family transcriptional regulator [Pseudomonas sp. M47T1]|uniref:AraC family transcriptional regulator n=1 Tax=unclassified Pseudomonas TaxID=196821 RepID=UPI0002607E20|nr:AraC family transcriptional regulator [Pseudomonas sp. M47T1]EIK93910.1 AraC family transcriptional regulator [Pseudomonas sp. M47T1]